jgi:hypothetical protein
MDRVFVRTCSSVQAAILARAAGRRARVGPFQVLIHRPAGREPIEPTTHTRYLARIEPLDVVAGTDVLADDDATQVVSALFGPYLA